MPINSYKQNKKIVISSSGMIPDFGMNCMKAAVFRPPLRIRNGICLRTREQDYTIYRIKYKSFFQYNIFLLDYLRKMV